jgi:hypothetical protein
MSVEGFIKYAPNKLHADKDLRDCQEHSLIFLYRLLFIMGLFDAAALALAFFQNGKDRPDEAPYLRST